jgi:hypothetical protein
MPPTLPDLRVGILGHIINELFGTWEGRFQQKHDLKNLLEALQKPLRD